MDININIKQDLVSKIINENEKKNIKEINLSHVPFSKFKVSIQQCMNYSDALELVKKDQLNKYGKIDIFECMKLASELMENFKEECVVTEFNITDKTIFISNFGFKIEMENKKIINLENIPNVKIEIVSDVLKREMSGVLDKFEKNKLKRRMCYHSLSLLLCIMTIFNDKKNSYTCVEREYREVKHNQKTKRKKKNNVTYINHKTITVYKSTNACLNKSYERHIESWVQRGHWRTYKTGKKVWIKECVKSAKGRSDKGINKTYEII